MKELNLKEINLKEINGNEIIDFLNKETRDNDDLCDISISEGSFIFEKQKIQKTKYELYFTASFNNWGTEQNIYGNKIYINKEGEVIFDLEEPFDGDSTDDALEEVLSKWLKTHKFNTSSEENFHSILNDVYEKLPCISFKNKKELQKVIDKLIRAQTYMK